MGPLCIVLFICCLGFLIKIGILKRQINHIKVQIDFLFSRDTQSEIGLERIDKSTEHLAESINRLLEKYRETGQQIKKNNDVFRDINGILSDGLKGLRQKGKPIIAALIVYAICFLIFLFTQ